MSPALVRDLILGYCGMGGHGLRSVRWHGHDAGTVFPQPERTFSGMEKAEIFYRMCRRRVYEAEQEQMKRLASS